MSFERRTLRYPVAQIAKALTKDPALPGGVFHVGIRRLRTPALITSMNFERNHVGFY
jgi:hypothetical protein